jgi:LysM repeat protein
MKKRSVLSSPYLIGVGLLVVVLLAGPVGSGFAHRSAPAESPVEPPPSSPIETPTFTPTSTANPTATATETPTATPTPTSTLEPTATSGPTSTPTPTSTETPTPTPTSTPGPTVTPGPTSTLTPSPTPTNTPASGSILGYHTVKPGETLFCIGRAYGVDPYAIAGENGIVNPSVLSPGQVLAIPNVPRSLPTGPVCQRQIDSPTPVPSPSGCRWSHKVVWGENLYRISLRYGVDMWTIANANGITNVHLIRAGQVLCIP